MKDNVTRNLLWLSILLLLLIILLFLIRDLVVYLDWRNLDNALTVAETNDAFCTPDNQLCVFHPQNLGPTIFSTDFSTSTGMLLLDLIGRLEYPNDAPISSPSDFTLVKELASGNAPVFCGMWTNADSLYIAFRGTKTASEWSKDFQTQQDPIGLQSQFRIMGLSLSVNLDSSPILVHSGFLDVFQEFEATILATITQVNPVNLYITGHSLGAGVATLAGLQYSTLNLPMVVYAFASPLVGNPAFAESVATHYVLHRITNRDDLIPLVPLNVMPNLSGDHQPYIYARAGTDHSFSLNWLSWESNHTIPNYSFCLSNSSCVLTTIGF